MSESIREELLVDYYSAVVGTVGGDNSYELVLYTHSDTQLKLSVFKKSEDEGETRADFLVPIKALEDCEEVIKKNKFAKWNKKYENIGMDGAVTVVKFRNGDGSCTRVSTDRMPDDGLRRMGEVQSALSAYLKDEYKV